MADKESSFTSEVPTANPRAARQRPNEGVDTRTQLESTLGVLLEMLPHLRQLRDRMAA